MSAIRSSSNSNFSSFVNVFVKPRAEGKLAFTMPRQGKRLLKKERFFIFVRIKSPIKEIFNCPLNNIKLFISHKREVKISKLCHNLLVFICQ